MNEPQVKKIGDWSQLSNKTDEENEITAWQMLADTRQTHLPVHANMKFWHEEWEAFVRQGNDNGTGGSKYLQTCLTAIKLRVLKCDLSTEPWAPNPGQTLNFFQGFTFNMGNIETFLTQVPELSEGISSDVANALFVELLRGIVQNLYPQVYNYKRHGETNMLFHPWLVSRETEYCHWSLFQDWAQMTQMKNEAVVALRCQLVVAVQLTSHCLMRFLEHKENTKKAEEAKKAERELKEVVDAVKKYNDMKHGLTPTQQAVFDKIIGMAPSIAPALLPLSSKPTGDDEIPVLNNPQIKAGVTLTTDPRTESEDATMTLEVGRFCVLNETGKEQHPDFPGDQIYKIIGEKTRGFFSLQSQRKTGASTILVQRKCIEITTDPPKESEDVTMTLEKYMNLGKEPMESLPPEHLLYEFAIQCQKKKKQLTFPMNPMDVLKEQTTTKAKWKEVILHVRDHRDARDDSDDFHIYDKVRLHGNNEDDFIVIQILDENTPKVASLFSLKTLKTMEGIEFEQLTNLSVKVPEEKEVKKTPASVGKTAALLEEARAKTNRKRERAGKSNFSPRKQPKRNVKGVNLKPYVPGQGGGMKKTSAAGKKPPVGDVVDVKNSSDSDSGAD